MSTKPMTIRLEEQLKKMESKNFMYMGTVVKVLSWKFDGQFCTVVTSRQWISRPDAELLKLLQNDFLETEEETESEETKSLEVPVEQLVSVPKLKSLETCDKFMDALTRAMDEVEHNSEFEDQAQVMVNITGKAIDYAKVQLDAYRLARDIVRNR